MTASPPTARREIDWIRVTFHSIAFCIMLGVLIGFPLLRQQAKRAATKAATAQLVGGMKQFATEFGPLPTGTNAQIIATLRGGNLRKIIFFECKPASVNANGEFIDEWGTPYRIDTTNPAFPWVYSFGQDRQDNGGAAGSDDVTSW